jgi:hypothetical protein
LESFLKNKLKGKRAGVMAQMVELLNNVRLWAQSLVWLKNKTKQTKTKNSQKEIQICWEFKLLTSEKY